MTERQPDHLAQVRSFIDLLQKDPASVDPGQLLGFVHAYLRGGSEEAKATRRAVRLLLPTRFTLRDLGAPPTDDCLDDDAIEATACGEVDPAPHLSTCVECLLRLHVFVANGKLGAADAGYRMCGEPGGDAFGPALIADYVLVEARVVTAEGGDRVMAPIRGLTVPQFLGTAEQPGLRQFGTTPESLAGASVWLVEGDGGDEIHVDDLKPEQVEHLVLYAAGSFMRPARARTRLAVFALGESAAEHRFCLLDDDQLVPLLLDALGGEPEQRRAWAAKCLGEIIASGAIKGLEGGLRGDPSQFVREQCAEALAQIGTRESWSALRGCLPDAGGMRSIIERLLEKAG